VKYKKRYVRQYTITDRSYGHFPMLTPKPHLVDNDCLFSNKKDAQELINTIAKSRSKRFNQLDAEYKKMKKSLSTYGNYHYGYIRNDRNTERNRCDVSNYSIEEYVPDFVCNKSRRKTINVWKDDASSKTFCSCCGSNIYYGDYAQIRQTKICPFCIKSLGEAANQIIEKHKKGDPDIEDNYNCTVFLEHMD
jgi:hypothetical protein